MAILLGLHTTVCSTTIVGCVYTLLRLEVAVSRREEDEETREEETACLCLPPCTAFFYLILLYSLSFSSFSLSLHQLNELKWYHARRKRFAVSVYQLETREESSKACQSLGPTGSVGLVFGLLVAGTVQGAVLLNGKLGHISRAQGGCDA